MFRYLVRRLLWAILLFIVITFVTFVIFFMAPNNPARGYCGGDNAKPQCLALATKKLGLDIGDMPTFEIDGFAPARWNALIEDLKANSSQSLVIAGPYQDA